MGDRRNVELVYNSRNPDTEPHSVFLYTHWHGSDLPNIIADALNSKQGRNRWTDPTYLARIIFTNMVKADGIYEDGETGFGISPFESDKNHRTIVIDLDRQTVDGNTYEEYIDLYANQLSSV